MAEEVLLGCGLYGRKSIRHFNFKLLLLQGVGSRANEAMNPIELMKELPLEVGKNAVREILQSFPLEDPMFEKRIDDILPEEEITIIEKRHQKIEDGESV